MNSILAFDANLYNLKLKEKGTYLAALAFVVGNIIFPQFCHLFGLGHMLLPIYFFTLIGAYKYGMSVGLLTALVSPLVNHYFFGMPPAAALPSIIVKSSLLAIAASYAAAWSKNVSTLALLLAVLAYQFVGTIIECAFIAPTIEAGLSDFRMSVPGMLLQVVGGYFVLRIIKD